MKNESLKGLIDKNKLLTEKVSEKPEDAAQEVGEARRRLIVKWTEKVHASRERKAEELTDAETVPTESA